MHSLEDSLGPKAAEWTWGRVNELTHPHPFGRIWPLNYIFNVGPFPASGGSELVLAHRSSISKAPHKILAGPSTRRLIDFGNPENSLGINPTGQSGNRFDLHYADQSRLYSKGKYRRQILSKQDAISEARSTLILKPQKDAEL